MAVLLPDESSSTPETTSTVGIELAGLTSTGLSTPGPTGGDEPTRHDQPTDETGRWATADRAVDDDAGPVPVGAEGRARKRLVPTAAVADGAENATTALLSATDTQRQQLADLPGLTRAGTCGAAACRRTPARCTHDLGAAEAPAPTRRW